jgi:hypothetical protein
MMRIETIGSDEIKVPNDINEVTEGNNNREMSVISAKIFLQEEIVKGDYKDEPLEQNEADDVAAEEEAESYAEKVEKQEKEIENVESGEKNLDNDLKKGNYGEMKVDQDLRDKGYERISNEMVTDVDGKMHQGLDGVYHNPEGEPQYIIVDAKYGSGQLSETKDGKQMSDTWVDARLDKDVGKEKADEIRMEKILNPDNVGSYVAHVDENGSVTYDKLDGNANVIEKDVKING